MSSVDNRVVEMEFVNDRFQKNIEESMNSLKNLDKQINTMGAAKGLEQVGKAADNVSVKFDAMQVAAATMIANITTSFYNMAKTCVSKVTGMITSMVSQIQNGGLSRAMKIEEAKFQLEGFGVAWNDIVEDINYGVADTAYGLDEAAKVAANLVTSGIELGEQMKSSLRGISGVAATTNSTYADIGDIFTTVAGNGRLMTMELRRLEGRGLNVAGTMAKQMGMTEQEIRNMVSAGKIDYETFVKSMDEAFGAHAKEANRTINGVTSNIKSALSKIGAVFYEDIIANDGPLVTMLENFRERINDIKSIVSPFLKTASSAVISIITKISDYLEGFDVTTIVNSFTSVFTIIGNILKFSGKLLSPIIETIESFMETFQYSGLYKLIQDIKELTGEFTVSEGVMVTVKNILKAIILLIDTGVKMFSVLLEPLKIVGSAVINIINTLMDSDGLLNTLSSGIYDVVLQLNNSTGILDFVKNALSGIANVMVTLLAPVSNLATDLGEQLKNWEGLKSILGILVSPAKSLATGLLDAFGSLTGIDVLEAKTKVIEFFSNTIQHVSNFLSPVISGIENLFLVVKQNFNTPGFIRFKENLLNIGNIIKNSGLGKGIASLVSQLKEDFKIPGWDRFKKIFTDIGDFFKRSGIVSALETVWNIIKIIFNGIVKVLGKTWDAIKTFVSKLSSTEGINGISSLISAGGFAALVLWLNRVQSFLETITETKGTYGITGFLNKGLSQLSLAIKNFTATVTANNIVKIAASILLLAYALDKMASIPVEDMERATLAMVGMFVGITKILQLVTKSVNTLVDQIGANQIGTLLLKMAASLLIVALAVGILAKALKTIESLNNVWQSIGALGVVLLEVTVALAILGRVCKGCEKTLLLAAASIFIVAKAIKVFAVAMVILSLIDADGLNRGCMALFKILLALTLFTKFGGDKTIATGASLLLMANGIMILCGAIAILGSMDITMLSQGMLALASVLGMLTIFTAFSGNKTVATGISILIVANALLLLTGVIAIFGSMNVDVLKQGLLAIAAVMGMFLVASAVATSVLPGMIVFSTAIVAIITAVSLLVATVSNGALIFGIGLNTIVDGFKRLYAIVDIIPVVFGAFGAGIAAFLEGFVKGFKAVVIAICNVIIETTPSIVAALSVAISGFFQVLTNILPAIGEFIITLVLTVAQILIEAAPKLIEAVFTVIAALVHTIAKKLPKIIPDLISIISQLNAMLIQLVPDIAKTLVTMLIGILGVVLANIGAIVDKLFDILITVINKVAERTPELVQALFNVLMSVFQGVIDAFSGADANVLIEGLSLIGVLTAIVAALAAIAPLAPIALIGAVEMTAVAIELAGLLAALGEFTKANAGITDSMSASLPLLGALGSAIGTFVGNLVGAMAGGISDYLPHIGENLSSFMSNAQGFINGAREIDVNVLKGVGIITAAIIALSAAELIEGISSFLSFGGSFADIGKDLSNFMSNAQGFFDSMKSIDDATLESTLTLCGILAAFSATELISSISSFVSTFFGSNQSMAAMGEELEKFAPHMVNFADETKGISTNHLQGVARAMEIIFSAAAALPSSGGTFSDWFFGNNDIVAFGDELVKFAPKFTEFAQSFDDLTDDQIDNTTKAMETFGKIVKIISTIPNEGGIWAAIAGDNSLGTFATELQSFGEKYPEAITNLASVSKDEYDSAEYSMKCFAAIIKNCKDIPVEGGIWAAIAGDNTLGKFSTELKEFGSDFASAVTDLASVDKDKYETAEDSMKCFAAIVKAANDIPNEGLSVVSLFVGDNDLATFSQKLITLGTNLGAFADIVSLVGIDTYKTAAKAVEVFAVVVENCKTISDYNGSSLAANVKDFLDVFGTAILGFYNKMNEIGNWNDSSRFTIMASDIESLNSEKLEELSKLFDDTSSQIIKSINILMNLFTDHVYSAKNKNSIKGAGKEIMESLRDGLSTGKGENLNVFKQLMTDLVTTIRNKYNDFYNAGKYIVTGLMNGIAAQASSDTFKEAVKSMGDVAIETLCLHLEIHSPSRVFEELGEYIPMGLANGIESMAGVCEDASNNLGDDTMSAMKSVLDNMTDLIQNDINPDLTITPVLDLTNVRRGAASIGSMLNQNNSLTLSTVGSITDGMNMRNSSASNEDIVSAIKSLSSEISGNVKTNNTYNINGITYDSGSDVSDAINTLIRAIRIEGRA